MVHGSATSTRLRSGSSAVAGPWLLVSVLAAVSTMLGGCRAADDLARLAPQLVAPGSGARMLPSGGLPSSRAAVELPPAQHSEGFDFDSLGTTPPGDLLYRVRIRQDGHPYQVATDKLTPLFFVDGKSAASYVSESYFRSNPQRTPFSIQPGDEFLLTLPADTFIVRWQSERDEQFGHPAHVREYVSERGDYLRYVLTDPFPIRYELRSADGNGRAKIQLHPDLAYLLGNRLTDSQRLAQALFRVVDPDLFQMEAVRRMAATLEAGVPKTIEIDRTQTYLDPAREIWARAFRIEPVQDRDREHLVRAVFTTEQSPEILAIEDAVGNRTGLDELVDGRVFRVQYYRDGTVRVFYKTGPDDARGHRDPYQLRENARWTAVYQRLAPDNDPPVKWGPGEPSDLEPFPTARDPHHRADDLTRAYDYLVPGRTLVLTFRPTRALSSIHAELEFQDVLRDLRDRYRTQIDQLLDLWERHQDQTGRP